MLKKLTVGEVFQEIGKAKTKEEVVALLKGYGNNYLLEYIKFMFDPEIEPDFFGVPPYKPSSMPNGMSEANLYVESRRLYIFDKKRNAGIKELIKSRVLQSILSGLSQVDCDFLLNLLQRKAAPPNLTREIIDEVFPGLIRPSKESTETVIEAKPSVVKRTKKISNVK
jgi:hypothetical protein